MYFTIPNSNKRIPFASVEWASITHLALKPSHHLGTLVGVRRQLGRILRHFLVQIRDLSLQESNSFSPRGPRVRQLRFSLGQLGFEVTPLEGEN